MINITRVYSDYKNEISLWMEYKPKRHENTLNEIQPYTHLL